MYEPKWPNITKTKSQPQIPKFNPKFNPNPMAADARGMKILSLSLTLPPPPPLTLTLTPAYPNAADAAAARLARERGGRDGGGK